ncbi:MAG: hypothetical protein AMXMBFR64_20100 [Myxococcales bacterium]
MRPHALLLLALSACAFPAFEPGGDEPVQVTSVVGNSPLATDDTPGVFRDGIVVHGSGLGQGLAAALRAGEQVTPLVVRVATGSEAELVLPADLEEGAWDLTLSRGSSATTIALRFSRGPAGPGGEAALGGFVTLAALEGALPDPATLVSEGDATKTFVLATGGPDLSAYAPATALDGLATTEAALAAYAHRDELLDPAGWPTKEALLAAYATPGDLPDLSNAILKADLPDTSPYVSKEAAAATIATQADVEAALQDKATMDASYLAKDGTLSEAHVALIEALVGQALAELPCPAGTTPVGASCVSTHEASVRDKPCASGGQTYGASIDDYPSGFPDSGGGVTKPLYACSGPGVAPSRHLTWFQAARACAASGLRLCTDDEWQRAVAGTGDEGCAFEGVGPVTSSDDTECVSNHGVVHGPGSLGEWTATWAQGGLAWVTEPGQVKAPWPLGYGDAQDTVSAWNGSALSGGAWKNGTPAAVVRGGSYASGAAGGAYAMDMTRSPAESAPDVGFRCCRSR